jgi:hypothetical protein
MEGVNPTIVILEHADVQGGPSEYLVLTSSRKEPTLAVQEFMEERSRFQATR